MATLPPRRASCRLERFLGRRPRAVIPLPSAVEWLGSFQSIGQATQGDDRGDRCSGVVASGELGPIDHGQTVAY